MRRISENTFGILANRWQVLRKPFVLKPEKVKVITYLVLILHKFYITTKEAYHDNGKQDKETFKGK